MKESNSLTLNTDKLKSRIYTIRGVQVMLDEDLAELYDVETGALNRAAKRNSERFPQEFMFQLTELEYNSLRCQIDILENLKSQFATSNTNHSNQELTTPNR